MASFASIRESAQSGDYFKFEKGENRIRLLTELEPVAKYFDPVSKKSVVMALKGAPSTLNGIKCNIRYVCFVADQKNGSAICLAELPGSVAKQISDLQTDSEWSFADLPPYDLKVTKTGDGMETRYTTLPSKSEAALPKSAQEDFKKKDPITEIVKKMIEKSGGQSVVSDIEDDIMNQPQPWENQ